MDNITIDSNIDSISQLQVSADAYIMENYQAALPVAAGQRMMAVQDNRGNPIVLSLSDDGHLYVILADEGSATGWRQIDLSDSLQTWGTPAHFCVGQIAGGNITLAVVAEQDGGGQTVVVAGPLPNDPQQVDWSQLSDLWVVAGNPVNGVGISEMAASPVDASNGFGMPFFTVGYQDGTREQPNNYLLTPTVASSIIRWQWTRFPTPTDATSFLDYAMGAVSGLGLGVYMLYLDKDQHPALWFQTLPNEYGRPYDRELAVPAGATCLQTTAPEGGTTPLYVGGSDGVYRFTAERQGQPDPDSLKVLDPEHLATGTDVPDIPRHGLIVCSDTYRGSDGGVAVWALAGEELMYFHDGSDGASDWSKPVLFENGVAQVVALRSGKRNASQLLWFKTDVHSDPALHYMFQDPVSSQWQRRTIPIEDTGNTLAFHCYTTTLAVTDQEGQPVVGLTLDLSASGWTRATVNGAAHILDQDTRVPVTTDALGNLTIINPVDDLATPLFALYAHDSGHFAGTMTIDPAHRIYQRLSALKSGDDIPDYMIQRALPDGVGKDDIARAIQQLMAYRPDGTSEPTATISYQGASQQPAASLERRVVRTPGDHVAWGLAFTPGKIAYLDADAVAEHQRTLGARSRSVVTDVWDSVTNLAGDLWQFTKAAVGKITHIIVDTIDGVLTFVVHLGEKILQIAIRTIQDIYKAITVIFQALMALLQDFIRWLGYLFGWQDIWDMHKILANLMGDGLDYLVGITAAQVANWKQSIAGFFDTVEDDIAKLLLPAPVASAGIADTSEQTMADNPQVNLSSPPTNWAYYQLQHGGVTSGQAAVTPPEPGNPLMQFVDDVLVPTVQGLEDDLKQVYDDLTVLFSKNASTEAFLTLVKDVAKTFLDAVENLILGLLDFAVDMLADFKSLIVDPLEIPFLSSLYRWVTGLLGEAEDLTAANVISLFFAIPMTIMYKMVAGESPLAHGTGGLDRPGAFARMLGGASVARKTSERMRVTGGADGDGDDGKDDDDDDDGKDAAWVYTHIIGLVSAFAGPISGFMGLRNLSQQMKLDGDLPTGLSEAKLKKNIGFMNKLILATDVLNLACSFPVPKGDNDTSDDLSYAIYGVSWANTIISFLIDLRSGGFWARVNAAQDAFWNVVQFCLCMPADAYGDENALKYAQDILTTGGSVVRDVGVFIKGTDGIGAGVRIGGYTGVVIGALLGFVHIISSDEDIVRVQLL